MVCLPKSGLNLRWSHARKKEILAKIALHYPEAERETVWEKVQRQYVVCKAATSFREIEEMEENLILPTFRKLKFVDCNKDPYLKEHPEYRDEKGYRRNK